MAASTTAEQLAPALLRWWDVHGRHELPWQQDPTPYRVWVSEIMLQQTQVATVMRYYQRFLTAFPDVVVLADAPVDAVLHHWSGLGYYARARNLHRAAALVRDHHGGVVPTDFDALAALPGIGRSTAGSLLSLSTGQRHPILDGNVKRVLCRVFRVEGYPGEAAVSRELWRLAEACTPTARCANYNQALMDLGASCCSRRRPDCHRCPLAEICAARLAGVAEQLPTRKAPRPRPTRTSVVVLAVRSDGAVLLERRPPTGIWGGLWGFPESTDADGAAAWCAQHAGAAPLNLRIKPMLRHAFSHFDLDITPVECRLPPVIAGAVLADADRWLWYHPASPAAVGLAAPVTRLLQSLAATPTAAAEPP
jgi:A/G-specific adenine glycosylase